tara:strand:+ start:2396 stop:2890 length:495 start_codon:yes stop_codon:yes gene_type:complete
MVKDLISVAFLFLFLNSCQTNIIDDIDKNSFLNNDVYIDVVQKKIFKSLKTSGPYSDKVDVAIEKWTNNEIKTDGFEGNVTIQVLSIKTTQTYIEDTMNFKIFIDIEIKIYKSALSRIKTISLKSTEYSYLTGEFSLDEKEIVIDNTIKKLIKNLSVKLSSKLS